MLKRPVIRQPSLAQSKSIKGVEVWNSGNHVVEVGKPILFATLPSASASDEGALEGFGAKASFALAFGTNLGPSVVVLIFLRHNVPKRNSTAALLRKSPKQNSTMPKLKWYYFEISSSI